MHFPVPKDTVQVEWQLSSQTGAIVEAYSKYSRRSPDDIADEFLKNLLANPDFGEYLKKDRRTKRFIKRIFGNDSNLTLLDHYAGRKAEKAIPTTAEDDY